MTGQSAEFLHKYEVLECLSRGTQSETFLVRSRETGGLRLAKIVPAAEDDGEQDILAMLNHPHIPKVLDCIETPGAVCIVREYIAGTPLHLLALPLDEKQVRDIGIKLCGILEYLHNQFPPLLHRDIKPQNVILDENNQVHLIDFGISRYHSEASLKDTRLMVTEGYAPPEQYGFGQTDCRADIYSLGILLCFLLTGSNSLSALPNENKKLLQVIRKCAEFAPKDRYHSATAVKKHLKHNPKRMRIVFAAAVALLLLAYPFFQFVQFLQQPEEMPEEISLPVFIAQTENTPPPIAYDEPVAVPAVMFEEPLIEMAVRARLGLGAHVALIGEDLARVDRLYIFGCRVFADGDAFIEFFQGYISRDDIISRDPALPPMTTFADLAMLPSLERLRIDEQDVTDIEPLAQLENLYHIYFYGSAVADLSPIAQMPQLTHLYISGGTFTDISFLSELPRLQTLGLRSYEAIDYTPLRQINSLEYLVIGSTRGGWMYLPDSPLRSITVSRSAVDSIEWFYPYADTLVSLYIDDTNITDLEGIEALHSLEVLYAPRNDIADLTPLLRLPNMQWAVFCSNMQEAVEAIREYARFDIYFHG